MGTKHNAKYIVTLTTEERKQLLELVGKGKAAAQKIKHANILLTSDENGENLPAEKVARAYRCHSQTVYGIHRASVLVAKGERASHENKGRLGRGDS